MMMMALNVSNDSIDLAPTRRLHEELIERWREDPPRFTRLRRQAAARLAAAHVVFEKQTPIVPELSLLKLVESDVQKLRYIAETLHGLIEKALDWILAMPARREKYLADHRRLFPWLGRTPGLRTWQGYSRYDAVVTPEGHVRIIELNTACPAGLVGRGAVICEAVLDALDELQLMKGNGGAKSCGVLPDVLAEALLHIEARAGRPPRTVAILNDENGLTNELPTMAAAVRKQGRDVIVADAAELEWRDGQLRYGTADISLTYNKMRISTDRSPHHHWKSGFERRYHAFLQAVSTSSVVAVNNLVSMTVAEDKSLLATLFESEVRSLFSDSEQEFLLRYVVPTARLDRTCSPWGADMVQPRQLAGSCRRNLVLKPAHEGRGFGVTVGRFCSDRVWRAACRRREDLPCVLQQYVEPTLLPVVTEYSGRFREVPMYLTLGLAIIDGRYSGLMPRLSAQPVTNVARGGTVQAAICETNPL